MILCLSYLVTQVLGVLEITGVLSHEFWNIKKHSCDLATFSKVNALTLGLADDSKCCGKWCFRQTPSPCLLLLFATSFVSERWERSLGACFLVGASSEEQVGLGAVLKALHLGFRDHKKVIIRRC